MVAVGTAGDVLAGAARFAGLACMGGRGLDGGEHRFGGDRRIAALQFFEARDHGAVCLQAFSFRAGGIDLSLIHIFRMSAGWRRKRARSDCGVSPVRMAMSGKRKGTPAAQASGARLKSGMRRFRSTSTARALRGLM